MIQSAGANQLKTVMSAVWDSDLFEKYDVRWMFMVHDEGCLSVAAKDVVPVIEQVHKFMTAPFLDGLPSASSIGLGKTFGTLVELGEVFDADKIDGALNEIFKVKEAA